MPAIRRTRARLRLVFAPAAFFASAFFLTAAAQPPDPKKAADPPTKADGKSAKDKDLPVVRLPDGTYLWLGNTGDGTDERVTLTPAELQKLLDQVEQLKKQLAARKATAPSGCAVRGKVQKRGEQLVAALTLDCTFRTTAPQTAVALGGRRGFLIAAALDGNRLPVLETTEDGFAVLVEAAGDHKLTLDLEAPVTSRREARTRLRDRPAPADHHAPLRPACPRREAREPHHAHPTRQGRADRTAADRWPTSPN